jgi:1-acyl-sn-glycerol-3-phosphate acyltransferase
MIKYVFLILRLGLYLLSIYPKIRRYAKHKDKYPKQQRYEFARSIIKRVDKALRVDFHVEGIENKAEVGNVVYLANHQSNFDPLLLIDLFDIPTTFVSKKETSKFPFVGKVAYFNDVLFMDRKNLRQSFKLMKEASRRLMEENDRIVIFPEGTRSKDELRTVAEFKAGAVRPALEAHSTIVPVAIFGSYKPLSTKYHQKKYRVDVKFFPPITYEDYKDKSSIDVISEINTLIKNQVDIFRLNQEDMVKLLNKN